MLINCHPMGRTSIDEFSLFNYPALNILNSDLMYMTMGSKRISTSRPWCLPVIKRRETQLKRQLSSDSEISSKVFIIFCIYMLATCFTRKVTTSTCPSSFSTYVEAMSPPMDRQSIIDQAPRFRHTITLLA